MCFDICKCVMSFNECVLLCCGYAPSLIKYVFRCAAGVGKAGFMSRTTHHHLLQQLDLNPPRTPSISSRYSAIPTQQRLTTIQGFVTKTICMPILHRTVCMPIVSSSFFVLYFASVSPHADENSHIFFDMTHRHKQAKGGGMGWRGGGVKHIINPLREIQVPQPGKATKATNAALPNLPSVCSVSCAHWYGCKCSGFLPCTQTLLHGISNRAVQTPKERLH